MHDLRGAVATLLLRAGPEVGGWCSGGSGGSDGMASAQVELRTLVDEVRRGCVRYACDGGGPIDSGGGGGSGVGGGGGDLEGDHDLECFEVACVALTKGGGGVSATEQLTNLVANPNLNPNPDPNPDSNPDPNPDPNPNLNSHPNPNPNQVAGDEVLLHAFDRFVAASVLPWLKRRLACAGTAKAMGTAKANLNSDPSPSPGPQPQPQTPTPAPTLSQTRRGGDRRAAHVPRAAAAHAAAAARAERLHRAPAPRRGVWAPAGRAQLLGAAHRRRMPRRAQPPA